MREFGPHQSTVADLDFSKDGSRIACAHYGGVTVWSLGQVTLPPRRFAWRGSHVALRWSTDGKFIATGTQENDIHVWRMAQATDMRMQGYPAKVKSLSWTADARFLYTSAQPVFTAWPFSGKGPEGKPPLQFGEEGAGLLGRRGGPSGRRVRGRRLRFGRAAVGRHQDPPFGGAEDGRRLGHHLPRLVARRS